MKKKKKKKSYTSNFKMSRIMQTYSRPVHCDINSHSLSDTVHKWTDKSFGRRIVTVDMRAVIDLKHAWQIWTEKFWIFPME